MDGTPEMIRRVARWIADAPVPCNKFDFRALLSACIVTIDGPIAITLLPRAVDFILEEIARLAIEAMHEPTEVMAEVGKEVSLAEGAHDCEVEMTDVWRAMIDAALHPRTSPEQGSE